MGNKTFMLAKRPIVKYHGHNEVPLAQGSTLVLEWDKLEMMRGTT